MREREDDVRRKRSSFFNEREKNVDKRNQECVLFFYSLFPLKWVVLCAKNEGYYFINGLFLKKGWDWQEGLYYGNALFMPMGMTTPDMVAAAALEGGHRQHKVVANTRTSVGIVRKRP